MKIQFKNNVTTRTVPLIGAGILLLSTNSFAANCAPPCNISGSLPELRFLDSNGPDWEVEADQGALLFDNDGGTTSGFFRIENGANEDQLVLDANGNVGIKTSSAQTDLEISDSLPEIRLDDTSAGGAQMDIGVNQNFMRIEGDDSQDIVRIYADAPSSSLNVRESGNLGLGTSSPSAPLHVRRGNGSAKVFVEETNATAQARTLFELKNKGNVKFTITNTSPNVEWSFANPGDSLRFSRQGSGEVEFQLDNNGDLEIAGALTENSDVNAKRDIEDIQHQAILAKVVQLPIKKWSYRDAPDVRHIGPMAQDFYQAFQLGHTEKGISTLDSSGVALAAIQALKLENNVLSKKVAEIDTLKSENEQLRIELNAMKEQLTQVENLQRRVVDFLAQASQPDMQQVSY